MSKGLVLLNMGGPNNLDEVEVFLTNMFNDPNIITIKNDFMRSVIAWLITKSRKKEATANYEALGGKSPLVGYTKNLIKKLQMALPDTCVTFAMRYTPPFAKAAVDELLTHGVKELCIIPLYPHYSSTTTKSSLEDFLKVAENSFKKISVMERFYDNEAYNLAIIEKIEAALNGKDASKFELIYSAHSLPQKIVDRGDPYQKEVLAHADILSAMLEKKGYFFASKEVAYQSKLGPVKWLAPELGSALKKLENKNALIVPLSFTLDNSETEFELDIEYREIAKKLGVLDYLVAACPNASDAFVAALLELNCPHSKT
ncbi:MAG: ferrochelatase [Campylobacteraceae bacterium]|nr:ferrochelatase [Campylobacteraceae bacterium]